MHRPCFTFELWVDRSLLFGHVGRHCAELLLSAAARRLWSVWTVYVSISDVSNYLVGGRSIPVACQPFISLSFAVGYPLRRSQSTSSAGLETSWSWAPLRSSQNSGLDRDQSYKGQSQSVEFGRLHFSWWYITTWRIPTHVPCGIHRCDIHWDRALRQRHPRSCGCKDRKTLWERPLHIPLSSEE